jgi:hypothetical protein
VTAFFRLATGYLRENHARAGRIVGRINNLVCQFSIGGDSAIMCPKPSSAQPRLLARL